MRSGTTDVRGLRLAYSEWGSPEATAGIVLVHGLGSGRHIWDLVAPGLADSYRVLALDQRGHGESEQPESGYDFESIVADLADFCDAVDAPSRLVLVGHSWGASVVLHFAVEHPERSAGIALVDGGTSSPGERWTWDDTLARLTPPEIDGLLWEDLHQRMSHRNGAFKDPRTEAIGRSLFNIDEQDRISRRLKIPNHLKIVRALWEQRPAELIERLRCPLLLLPARQEGDAAEWRANKEANVQRALSLQPTARLRWFEDTVHDVPLQRPDKLAAEISAFAGQIFSQQAPESSERAFL